MGERKINYVPYIPHDVMTVTINDERKVLLDVKAIKKIWTEGEIGDIKQILFNIGFYIDDGSKKYVGDTNAKIKIPYNDEMRKAKENDSITFLYYFDKQWVVFDDQEHHDDYVELGTTGWTEDPSIGWR